MRDIVTFNNCHFVYDQINEGQPANNFLSAAAENHMIFCIPCIIYNTRCTKNNAIIT